MKKGYPPIGLCAGILALALLWRMVGAPLNAAQFQQMQTPLWQARVLWPSRVARVFRLWLPAEKPAQADTLLDDAMDEDEQAIDRLSQGGESVTLNVYISGENRLAEMTLEGYVCGVVAAEMPATYHVEALKAQAVAARTRALWQMANGGCALHPGADICTDSAHCQGYATLAECQAKWGNEYELYRDRILQAERDTRDELLTYEGEPITVMYHAISGGRTEDVSTVFSESLPYLVSVASDSEEDAKGLLTDTTLTFEDIASALNAAIEGMQLTGEEVRRTLSIGEYTDTGRVKSMQVGSSLLDATDFRRALGLRSTWFSLSMDDSGVTFHQRGYGHGVGMSQAGANGMAADGASYSDILLHYYPGVTLEKR